MSYNIDGTTITLTRGDTLYCYVSITDKDGSPYTPVEGDSVRFAVKSKYTDPQVLINKDIPIDTMTLKLDPEDTKSMSFGKYVYDIQLTRANGDVHTFVTKSQFILTEEVD